MAADVALIDTILTLDLTGGLDDPEASFYAGFATLGTIGDLALRDELDELNVPLDVVLADAIGNIETGLAVLPHQEVRGLNGALHVFEAHLGDLLV